MDTPKKGSGIQSLVRRQILEIISRMDFEYSTKLLSEQQLAARLQVSRSTIRTVLAGLETEGKLIRRQGSGTYVNPPALDVETTLFPGIDMYDLITKNGFQATLKILSIRCIPAGEYGKSLNIQPFEKIIELRSVYYADGIPCMYAVDRMPVEFAGGVDWQMLEKGSGSIHEFIDEQEGIDIAWDIVNIKAATNRDSEVLQSLFPSVQDETRGLVRLEIHNFNAENRETLYGNIYMDSEKIRLSVVRDIGFTSKKKTE